MNNDNETIETLWNNPEAMLVGVGNAVFESYVFEIGDGYDEAPRAWKFTAAEVEEFARTW